MKRISRNTASAPAPINAPAFTERDNGGRDELILRYLHLVKFIASRVISRLPPHIEIGDLINSGVIGLLDAIEKFDQSRGIQFKTYAEFRIRGAMLDELRVLDFFPRSLRQWSSKLERAANAIAQKKKCSATPQEIAEYLGISIAEVDEHLAESCGAVLLSFEDSLDGDNGPLVNELLAITPDKKAINPRDYAQYEEHMKLLVSAIKRLPAPYQIIITLYYFSDVSMLQIGEMMDITESRVSQLHSKAIIHLWSILYQELKDTNVICGLDHLCNQLGVTLAST